MSPPRSALLEALDERDPELAEEVRSRMLTFADIVKLETATCSRCCAASTPAVLALAMKGASESVDRD